MWVLVRQAVGHPSLSNDRTGNELQLSLLLQSSHVKKQQLCASQVPQVIRGRNFLCGLVMAYRKPCLFPSKLGFYSGKVEVTDKIIILLFKNWLLSAVLPFFTI